MASMEAFQQFSLSASSNNEIDTGDICEETTGGKDFLTGEGDSDDTFSSYASAQDTFELEKQQSDASYGSSPRGVLDISTGSSCSESSSSMAESSSSMARSISDPETPAASPTTSLDLRGFFSLWKPKSMRRLSMLPSLRNLKLSKRESRRSGASSPAFFADLDFCCLKPSWKNFTIEELRLATNNFSAENVLGKGGYGDVYKGRLPNGQLVAIKRMTRGTAEDLTSDFLSEIGIIVHINHRNAAKLIGFGVEGGMHIVLKLSPNGNVASLLHGSKEKLNWSIRYKIAVGTAEGLQYLHVRCPRRIIHRDIKAANILLTEDFEPQISDFGLAKWLPDHWTHHTVSKFEGTFGYLAPEYSMHGIVDEKTDVFAFGVLLLELISGRQAVDSLQKSLVMWAMPLLEKNNIRELVDPSLANAYDSQQMSRVASAASLCIQHSSIRRPQMSQIVQLLKGQSSLESTKPSPQPVVQRSNSDVEDYNSSRYLNDLNRHRQLALDY